MAEIAETKEGSSRWLRWSAHVLGQRHATRREPAHQLARMKGVVPKGCGDDLQSMRNPLAGRDNFTPDSMVPPL